MTKFGSANAAKCAAGLLLKEPPEAFVLSNGRSTRPPYRTEMSKRVFTLGFRLIKHIADPDPPQLTMRQGELDLTSFSFAEQRASNR